MRACNQSTIFSIGGKFCPDYGLLLELHALTLVTRSYALLTLCINLQLMHSTQKFATTTYHTVLLHTPAYD